MAQEAFIQKDGEPDNIVEQVDNGPLTGQTILVQDDQGNKTWEDPSALGALPSGTEGQIIEYDATDTAVAVDRYPAANEDDVYSQDNLGNKIFREIPVNYFLPTWVSGQVKKGTLTFDNGWTMLSNKVTDDRAAPNPIGDALYGFDDTETYDNLDNSSVVYSGHTYTFTKTGWVDSIRVRVPKVTDDTNYRFIIDNLTKDERLTVEEPVLTIGGWTTIVIGATFVIAGEVWRAYIDALDTSANYVFNGKWTKRNEDDGDPIDGEWTVDGSRDLQIAKVDNDAVDRTADLSLLTTNSEIFFVDDNDSTEFVTYRVIEPSQDMGTFYYFRVERVTQGEGGPDNDILCGGLMTVPTPQPTSYYSITDHWLTNPQSYATIEGFLEFSGQDQGVDPNTGFGIDIRFQEAYISPDWDLVSFTGSIGTPTTQGLTELASTSGQIQGGILTTFVPDPDDILFVWDKSTGAVKYSTVQDTNTIPNIDATLSGDGSGGDPLRVTNPFTIAEDLKLQSIEVGAQVNTINAGDNVSLFVNDVGYLTAVPAGYVQNGDNVSLLTNDANYVASGANISVFTNDAGYITDVGDIQMSVVLVAESVAAAQGPVALDTIHQIEFGPAQFGGGDPVQIDALGNITFNEAGVYQLDIVRHLGRSGGGGIAQARMRTLLNGAQAGPTRAFAIDTSDQVDRIEDCCLVTVASTDVLTFEIVRDSSGMNDGFLEAQSNAVGWNTSPSAYITISRVKVF